MDKKPLVSCVILFCFFLFSVCLTRAQGEVFSTFDLDQEIISGQQEIKAELEERQDNAQTAKTEEEMIEEQINAAMISDDLETVMRLRRQLDLMRQENMQEKNEDRLDIQSDIQELRSDINQARQDDYLPPKFDRDNNPPGLVGGAGTNWENPPGPRGGPGASPDHR